MSVPAIFDHAHRAARLHRRREGAFLSQQLELRALERVEALTPAPTRIAISGGASADFLDKLKVVFPYAVVHAVETGADEKLSLNDAPDLFIDLGALALLNDVPGFLIQIRQALAPGGKFTGLLYGGGTLQGLRAALLAAESEITGGVSARLHPMIPLDGAITLLQRAGFGDPVADRESITVRYTGGIKSLAADLRDAGLSNALGSQRKVIPPKRLFGEAEKKWDKIETFEVISLSGWKPA